tara:strand:- start:258 stop:536 length:279 start_codon:yes stop_codon:yes gene_type:complete
MLYIVEDFDIRIIKEGCTLTITPMTFNQAKNLVANVDTAAVFKTLGSMFFIGVVKDLGGEHISYVGDVVMNYDTDLLVLSKVDGEIKFWMVR